MLKLDRDFGYGNNVAISKFFPILKRGVGYNKSGTNSMFIFHPNMPKTPKDGLYFNTKILPVFPIVVIGIPMS